jgi:hypothetical protein
VTVQVQTCLCGGDNDVSMCGGDNDVSMCGGDNDVSMCAGGVEWVGRESAIEDRRYDRTL